ncbi:MAG: P-loop NTPase [Oscillospiraceae bacterium]|nr:P-loop NTPase [Oscillospiraceae bacterium]
MLEAKKITVFAGHYGSGKSNLAVNYAFWLKQQGKETTLLDLDIVNPYFRSKDSEKELGEAGIRVIASEFANSNVDVPALPPAAYSMFTADGHYSVVDLGGDDRGSLALGRFSEMLAAADTYEMLLVINQFRPDTATPEGVLEVVREIEDACHVKFTGIANNTNLGAMTEKSHVLDSVAYAKAVSDLIGLPVVMTAYRADLGELDVPHPFPITLTTKAIWSI